MHCDQTAETEPNKRMFSSCANGYESNWQSNLALPEYTTASINSKHRANKKTAASNNNTIQSQLAIEHGEHVVPITTKPNQSIYINKIINLFDDCKM